MKSNACFYFVIFSKNTFRMFWCVENKLNLIKVGKKTWRHFSRERNSNREKSALNGHPLDKMSNTSIYIVVVNNTTKSSLLRQVHPGPVHPFLHIAIVQWCSILLQKSSSPLSSDMISRFSLFTLFTGMVFLCIICCNFLFWHKILFETNLHSQSFSQSGLKLPCQAYCM